MSEIFITTVPANKARVAVHTKGTSGSKDHREGNVEAVSGNTVTWMTTPGAVTAVEGFMVEFVDLRTGGKIWPFAGTGGGSNQKTLLLKPDGSMPLITNTADETFVKYEVSAIPPAGTLIDKCDPMLIIRPTLISRVTLGLVCALAGAIVGALLALRFG